MYNAQRAGITSAIVISILLPLGICAFCLIMHLRNRAIERNDGGGAPPKAAVGRTNVGQRFGPDRSSGNSSGKKGSTDSDRDSGFHANGKVTAAPARNDSDDDVRYNNERFQRKAPEREDSLKGGIIRQPVTGSKAESYSGSKRSSASDLLDLDSPPPPASRPKVAVPKMTTPSLEDVVRHRPPVTRLPSSGRSTPSSPSSPTSAASVPIKQFPAKSTSAGPVPKSQSDNNSFQPKQPLRGSSRSTSSERLLAAERTQPNSFPLLNQLPVASAPKQPVSSTASSASSNFKPEPTRGSGRSTGSSVPSSQRPGQGGSGNGAVPKTRPGPGSITSSSTSSPPPPLPTTLPPPITSDSEDETDMSPSDFDGVYYTNEPLVNKPRVEFPSTKPMDKDIDMKSYKSFSAPSKKPSQI